MMWQKQTRTPHFARGTAELVISQTGAWGNKTEEGPRGSAEHKVLSLDTRLALETGDDIRI